MKKIYNIYLKLITIILGASALALIIQLTKNNILPLKYLIGITLVLVIITGLLIILIIKKNTKLKWLISIISIVLIIVYTTIQILLGKTINFIENVTDSKILTENYSIIVLKDYKGLVSDIETLGYYQNQNISAALDKLSEKLNTTNKEYENIDSLVEALYDKKTEAIIMEDTYYNIYGEENDNFRNDTKIIYTFSIEEQTENIQKQVDTNMQPFNIYISGIDTYGAISSVSRSDVNIIATINPNTNKVLLTTIPRDYYVQLDGTTGLKDKLTHAGIYGVEKSVKTLENLLDIDINYYVKVNFSSVEKIVDALGGVNVYSKYSFIGFEGSSFNSGYNRVDGAKALEFARTRKTVVGGDRTRGMNQEALIEAILDKVCSKEILTKYSSLLDSLEGSFQTNMTKDEITNIIKNQIDKMPSWTVESISLDGTNSYQYTYSYGGRQLFVIIPNEDTIDNFHERLEYTLN